LVLVAPSLQNQIAGDAEEERSQLTALRIKAVGPSQQSDENILRDVLGNGRRICHSPGEAVDRILMLLESGPQITMRHYSIFPSLEKKIRRGLHGFRGRVFV
jgi:hypothetical protein